MSEPQVPQVSISPYSAAVRREAVLPLHSAYAFSTASLASSALSRPSRGPNGSPLAPSNCTSGRALGFGPLICQSHPPITL